MICTRGYDESGGRNTCGIHVDCDIDCRAQRDPFTIRELIAAVEHWQKHRLYGGCSHGH